MARKSRKNLPETPLSIPNLYISTALYIRLSVEDNQGRGNSIENQQLILDDYIIDKPEFKVYNTYVDNGLTGTNFERPAFQRMLSDIEAGHIRCVIVKDLSRLGRNAIDAGYYIEQYFSQHNVRFIAITDGYDTADSSTTNGIILPLKNMINEAYAIDIGRKIKAQAHQAMLDGDFIGARAPFGYRKAPDNCHKLLIDEETAPIVRQIFEWAADGVGITTIVVRLTVKEIGGTRMKLKDESEWIKIPDHHTPIISKELYEEANEKLKRFTITKGNNDYLLKGKVFCGCCDHAMSFTNKRNFSCVFSKAAKEFDCHDLKISAKTLQQAVFDTLRLQIGCVLGTADILNETSIRSAELQEHEQKIQQLQDSKRQLYEQYVTGELDVESYKTKKAELEVQLTLEKNICSSAAAQAKSAQCEYETVVKRNEIIKELDIADTLTKALDELLIERVYVFPDNRIEIVYKTRSIF